MSWRKNLSFQAAKLPLEATEEQENSHIWLMSLFFIVTITIFSGRNSLLQKKFLLHLYVNKSCIILSAPMGHLNLAVPWVPETQHCHNNSHFFHTKLFILLFSYPPYYQTQWSWNYSKPFPILHRTLSNWTDSTPEFSLAFLLSSSSMWLLF